MIGRSGGNRPAGTLGDVAHAFDFPEDLVAAQAQLRDVERRLDSLYGRLPWSAEPLPGWDRGNDAGGHYYKSSRADSPGWTPTEQQEIASLREARWKLAETVVCHPYWTECVDAPSARSALKHQGTGE